MPRGAVLAIVTLALCACLSSSPHGPAPVTDPDAQITLPPMRLFGPAAPTPPSRANPDMAQDFLDLSFRLETGQEIDGLSRFAGPITVRMTGSVPPTASHDLVALLARFQNEAGISIALGTNEAASINIEFMTRRQLQSRAPDAACFVAPRVSSWAEYRHASRDLLDWSNFQVRDRLSVFIPSDTSPQEVRDCLHEELAQALGPLNDLFRLPDSVFNDDNIQNILTGFDMLMLRVTYAPELRPGMAKAEVAAALPAILGRMNPAGQRPGNPVPPTPRAYGDAITRALGHSGSSHQRQSAAAEALAISEPWKDHRSGFAWLAIGRLADRDQKDEALSAFQAADQIFRFNNLPLHTAHASMQLAAFDLAEGRWEEVIARADSSIPVVFAAQNAALLSAFMMAKAEALDHLGRTAEANRLRLDSLGWARYGMNSDNDARRRMASLASLAAQTDKAQP